VNSSASQNPRPACALEFTVRGGPPLPELKRQIRDFEKFPLFG
jgi:hypothetical protein